jgi:hypothetical protein
LNGHTLPIGIVYPEKAVTCFAKSKDKAKHQTRINAILREAMPRSL